MRIRGPAALLSLALFAVTVSPPAGAAGKNLVDNPSFDKGGEEPVPDWTVRTVTGKTTFRCERGRLVADRGPGPGVAADSVLQLVYLPRGTRALRVSLRAACERLRDGRLVLRMVDRNGGPLARRVLFRFAGSRKEAEREKDVSLPEGTKDVELVFEIRGEGRLLVQEVGLFAIDLEDVRGEARVVDVTGAAAVSPAGAGPVERGEIRLPLPPATETQCPVTLAVRTEPSGRLFAARVEHGERGSTLVAEVGPLDAGLELRMEWTVRALLTGREDARDLPDVIPIVPARHLPRRLAPWSALADGERPDVPEPRPGDLRDLVREAGRRARGDAGRAARLLRAAELPARPVTLLAVGEPSEVHGGVEVFTKDFGWLRFGLGKEDPRPLPCHRHVLLGAPGPEVFVPPLEPSAGERIRIVRATLTRDLGGPEDFRVREAGSFVLAPGQGPDLIGSLAGSWERCAREVDPAAGCRVDPGKLGGKARKLRKVLEEWMRE
jgi:hypothetical protein